MEEADLLGAWRAGDTAAGQAFFERHYDALHRFFDNKTSGETADLVQETLEACVAGRDRIRASTSVRGYLFGIAYNVLRRHYERTRLAGERFDPEAQSVADAGAGPGTMAAKGEAQRRLLEGLRRIPLELQVVLELFYWEEMTSAAIADALGEPHGTIRTRVRRARQLLRIAIETTTEPGGDASATDADLDEWAAQIRAAQDGPHPSQ
ncbi:MAG: sigma-70 family RNA polymerase sigma factor [Deltaproteobacteria bacterium]|nr:sigma-70 family RNA polymerase sigma factor [Deltaproteobacteria bacterium]